VVGGTHVGDANVERDGGVAQREARQDRRQDDFREVASYAHAQLDQPDASW
jgi:hypothetical protein